MDGDLKVWEESSVFVKLLFWILHDFVYQIHQMTLGLWFDSMWAAFALQRKQTPFVPSQQQESMCEKF